jgi:hypothetical protein
MKCTLISICLILSSLAALAQPSLPVPSVPFKTNQNVELTWDASPTLTVSYYLIRRGVRSGVYDQMIRVDGRLTTSLTWSNAPTSVTNYFVASAVNTSGLESDPSNELAVTMERKPISPIMRTAVPVTAYIESDKGDGNWRLRAAVGPYYVVTESTNENFRVRLAVGDTIPVFPK